MTASFIAWALPYIITAGGAIAALAAIWFGGRKSAQTDAKLKDAKANEAAQERMNEADNLRDADDDARTKWLRDFGQRNRRP
jgi:hypothetical protein